MAFVASEEELSVYSMTSGKIYPKHKIKHGDPMDLLLAGIYKPRCQEVKHAKGECKIPLVAACMTWPLNDEHCCVKSPVNKGR